MSTETETRQLIDRLAGGLAPARPIASPARQLGDWLGISLPFVAFVVIMMSPRADLMSKLAETRFLLEQGAALATALTAAVAAFAMVVPGRRRWLPVLPLVPAGLWITTLGAGCLADYWRAGAAGLRLSPDAACLGYVALIGSLPALTLVIMLRRGAPLAPRRTVFFAVLASAALGNFGLRFFHLQDAGLMVLFWQFGSVLLLSTLAGLCGPRFLCWRHRKT